MEENIYLDKLARRDIKPTAIRLLILKNMMEVGQCGIIARFGNVIGYG